MLAARLPGRRRRAFEYRALNGGLALQNVLEYQQAHGGKFLNKLKELLRLASVSAQPAHSEDVRRCAQAVRDYLAAAGIQAEVMETGGHPAVVGDSGPVEGGASTVLVYGHYDVQPAGDPDLWQAPPFEPTERDGAVFARGAADDKGQFLAHVFAAECWTKGGGGLPLRVKFLIEGEEEVGSANLEAFVKAHRDRLACDYVVLSDTAQLGPGRPAITYGVKGMVYKEVFLYGPRNDLHSGSFGGTVANPANVLAHIIAALHDADGRVSIPGFYDAVLELSAEERARLQALPFDEEQYLKQVGSPALFGEKGYNTQERRWARPTLDVNGIVSGYTGEGASTIIPAKASAKVSMRLVPNQDPRRISLAFDRAVESACPSTVRIEIVTHALVEPYIAPLDSPGVRSAARAVTYGFGVEPAFIREGGSLPILPLFKEILGADSIMIGLGQPNNNVHGPNEFIVLSDFEAGIRTSSFLYRELARMEG
jgi:acetylornithine deacetylase/succinyl-diaminopimelate desuccinylase-like protein